MQGVVYNANNHIRDRLQIPRSYDVGTLKAAPPNAALDRSCEATSIFIKV
jgi:hypothetical protein